MTLVVTHPFVSPKPQGGDSTRVYGPQWNANHAVAGTADASQLNANVVQAVTNDANVTGLISAQNLTLGWAGTLAAARLNANVVQAVTNETNIHGSISAQNLTFSWSGLLGLSRGGTNADLSATGGAANYLKQVSLGAAVTVGTIPASDIASGAALTRVSDTNVTLTLGGTPATSLLAATSITVGWSGTLAASRGGFGADVSASAGVPLFTAGVPTFTGTTGSLNFVRATSPTLVTPVLGTPSSGTLTNCTGLPLAGLTTQAAFTFVGNNSGSTAVPTAVDIAALTSKTAAGTDLVMISDQAASGAWKKALVSSLAGAAGVSSLNGQTGTVVAYFPPQGRLTLQTGVPVMTTTQSAKTTIFYTPYVGNMVPIYDGTNMVPTVVAEISVATTDTTKSPAAIGASKVNDWFVWNDSGTIRIGHGPDWTSDTARSAGTALTMVNGILLNNASITNGPAASRGTYIGTTRSNGSSQLDWIFGASASGGTAGFFGIWNMYNRTTVNSTVTDSGVLYTYTSATIRQARASAGNQVSFVSGLAEDGVNAAYNAVCFQATVTSAVQNVGIGLDNTAGYVSIPYRMQAYSATQSGFGAGVFAMIAPQLGLHTISANENSDGTNANSFDTTSLNQLGFSFRM